MFLYVEQDVNLAWQSCSGLKNLKIAEKNVKKNPGKSCFAVGKPISSRRQSWALLVFFNIFTNKK